MFKGFSLKEIKQIFGRRRSDFKYLKNKFND